MVESNSNGKPDEALLAEGRAAHYHSESESEDLEMEPYEHSAVSRRRRRTMTNPSLGDRLVMDEAAEQPALIQHHTHLSKEDQKIADVKVLRSIAVSAIFVALWYCFSLLISVYNKWMFAPDHLNFRFPLFVTAGHMLIQFSLSGLVLFAFPHLRPSHAVRKHDQAIADAEIERSGQTLLGTSRADERKKQQSGVMTRWFYLTRLFPCGAATGLDIGLGNMSLRFISLAFYTMCKSSVLGFVLLFAFIFKLEQPTWKLVGIIAIMTIGVIMMVAGEMSFNLLGFILVMTASSLSGLRWSLTQVLLLRNPATSNPFSSIFYLAPVMFVSIFLIAIPIEGFGPLMGGLHRLIELKGFLPACGILVFPGFIAFLMVSSEFALLQRTSVVTLSICGILKEVMTISTAAIVFDDKLTVVNISGVCVTIIGIATYNYIRITKMRREAGDAVANQRAYVAVGDDDEDEDLFDSETTRYSVDEAVQVGEGDVRKGETRDEGVQAGSGAGRP